MVTRTTPKPRRPLYLGTDGKMHYLPGFEPERGMGGANPTYETLAPSDFDDGESLDFEML